MKNWYHLLVGRQSPFAEIIYHRFLERLHDYTEGKLNEELLRQHALRYLLPSIHLLKSPFEFPAMEKAVQLLRDFAAREGVKKLVLYGDRDADGVTSTVLLALFCREQLRLSKEQLVSLVPREEDKYGITDSVAERIVEHKPDLLITLDCGSSNKKELAQIKSACACPIIVIDHHFIPAEQCDYPDVEAFINPKLLPEFEFVRDYCTAAITLRFIQAVLYSYSREYNEPIGIETLHENFVLKNGVRVLGEHSPTRRYHIGLGSAGAERHDLLRIFEHTARENAEVRRLWDFYRKAPEAFSPQEIFNAVQSASFRKSHAILAPYLPFAAIGLVADLMPVYADNRIIVKEGLSAMIRLQHLLPAGLAALLKRLNLAQGVTEQDLGFSVCPVINAAGRMGNAALALDALTESDPLEATKAANRLVQINDARKVASQASLDLLDTALDARSHTGAIAVAIHDQFHRGISGLLASKIAERLGKPAVVLVPDGDCYRGSARAFKNENVHALIDRLRALLLQYGGHRQAAGFSVAHENLSQFIDALFATAPSFFAMQDSAAAIDPFRNFTPALEIETDHMRMPLWDELLAHAPYGVMNPHPVLSVRRSGKIEIADLGKTGSHAVVRFASAADRSIEGVWFFHNGEAANAVGKENLTVHGEPQVGRFMGRVQYRLKITQVTDGE